MNDDKENLCGYCRKADKTCPVYNPGAPTYKCVEWRPFESITLNAYAKLSNQNSAL